MKKYVIPFIILTVLLQLTVFWIVNTLSVYVPANLVALRDVGWAFLGFVAELMAVVFSMFIGNMVDITNSEKEFESHRRRVEQNLRTRRW